MLRWDYAIVCTLVIPPNNVEPVRSFITYHLAIGFDHIYLFIDDPTDEEIVSVAEEFGQHVTTLRRSDLLLSQQESACTLFSGLSTQLESDVPSRQMLNAEYASYLSTQRGFKWLLHIDIDEVGYTCD